MKTALPIALAIALTACAARTSSPYAVTGRQCFNASQVSGYAMAGDSAVAIQVGANRFYHLQLSGYCPDVDRARGIAIRTTGGSAWICSGLDSELIVPDSVMGPQRCFVTAVQPISRAEYLAVRRR